MDSINTDLILYFAGAGGEVHLFRINNLYNEVTVDAANAAMDVIAGTGAFVDGAGAYYQTPVSAVLTTTETKTISKR